LWLVAAPQHGPLDLRPARRKDIRQLPDGHPATDLTADDENNRLTAQGYTIRHVETWRDHGSYIVWDAPEVSAADYSF
jgi:hypothetical protein